MKETQQQNVIWYNLGEKMSLLFKKKVKMKRNMYIYFLITADKHINYIMFLSCLSEHWAFLSN